MSMRVFGPNNYSERCVKCGGRIAAGAGMAGQIDGNRVAWCQTHRPTDVELNPASAEAPGVYFDLSPVGDAFSIVLRGRHPRDAFDKYISTKQACGVRATKVDGRWQDSCTIPMVGRVWKGLTDAGFTVTASPRAAAAMQGAAAQQQSDDAAVQSRLTHPRAANLFPFQREGVKWLSSRTGAILADEMGCIDGEAEVVLSRAGKTSRITLEKLFLRFNGAESERYAWDRSIPTKVRVLADGVFRHHTVKAVLDKGWKSVVSLTLASGKTLRLTPDHEVGRPGGMWTPAEQLRPGDEVLANGKFVDADGYVRVTGMKAHPRANPAGQVYEHILVMEERFGRAITTEEHVHHRNGDKQDNRPENLEVLSATEHRSKHGKEGGFAHFDGAVTGKGGVAVYLPKVDRVVSVEPDGHAHVYDIVMDDPHRNFVANGIVVHNCGKTIQALMALGDKRPVILVVPASLKLNWRNEAAKWRPEYKVTVLKGRGTFQYPKPGEIVIINYDILPKAMERLEYGRMPPLKGVFANPPSRLTIIADEAHAVKNAKAQRTENFRFLGDIARQQAGQVWLLTGTPLLNRPPELWSVFSSGGFAKEAFGSFDAFKEMFNARQGSFGIEWGAPSPQVSDCIRRVQLRREKKDVLRDLPSKMRKLVPIAVEEVSAMDKKLFDTTLVKLEEQERKIAGKRAISKDEASAVAAFPMFTEFSTALTALAYAKTEPTIDYIKAFIAGDESKGFAGETTPFLVFSAHVEPLRMVKRTVEAAGIKCGIITGDVSSEERAAVVAAFQAGKLDCVCISIKAGGVGLTLTRATHSVFIDLEVVPALNVQAEDRIHRIGQTMPVTIHQMVLDHPLDQHVHGLVSRKMALFESTVGASTYLPTDTIAPNASASATVQAAAQIVVAEPTKGRPDARPAAQVRAVEYQIADQRRRVVVPESARPSKDIREEWAARAIAALTAMDDDKASEENGMGWNKADSSTGHMFNALIGAGHGLTDSQWDEALGMLGKYHAQVGRGPALPSGARKATRRTTPQPAEVGPPAAPDRPAPIPTAAQGIGTPGRFATGEVVCVKPPTAFGGTVHPATFATADGRRIFVRGDIELPAKTQLAAQAVYQVRFRVVSHAMLSNGTMGTTGETMEVLRMTRPPPARGPAPVQGIAGNPFAGMLRYRLWDRQ